MIRICLAYSLSFIVILTPMLGFGSICGQFNLFGRNVEEIRRFLKETSPAIALGTREIQCGIGGEDFRICRQCTNNVSNEQHQILRRVFGNSEHRRWHQSWHNTVPLYEEAREISRESFETLYNTGNIPANTTYENFNRSAVANAGESFLFMHRQMIKMMHIEMTGNALPCITPWDPIPTRIDDPEWPVSRELQNATGQEQLDKLNKKIQDLQKPEYLRTVTLDELGRRVSAGDIHGEFHFMWNHAERTARNCPRDNPTCESLLRLDSAQVNPVFWKFHGVIDNFISRWLTANDFETISESCEGKRRCYEWKGNFIGSMPNR